MAGWIITAIILVVISIKAATGADCYFCCCYWF